MWICPNCSNGNEDVSKFCTECGSPRPVQPIPQSQFIEESWQDEPTVVMNQPRDPEPWGQPGEETELLDRNTGAWNQPSQPAQTWNQPAQNWGPQTQPAQPVQNWGPLMQPEKKKSKTGLVIGIVSALVLALAGLLIFLFLSGGPRFREVRYTYNLWDGTSGEDVTTYQGKTGRIDTYEDGVRCNYSTFTCNKEGYIQTELYYAADGTQISRLEYEYDKNGNPKTIRRYSPEGNLELLIERTYNDYRVIEHSVNTYYTDFGTVDYRTIVEFSDRNNGLSYELDSNGQRTDKFTYFRVYDSNNQLTEEKCFDADDGELFRVSTYQRDKYHYVQSYVIRYYDGDESYYTYEYEQIK
jgi:hypothetical protein